MDDEKKVATTTGGAIGISVFASFIGLCCIGPWAVVLFGVSGAVTMARWAPLRPYFIGVAAVMLAIVTATAASIARLAPSNAHRFNWARIVAMDDEKKVATTTGGAIGISVFASFIGLCCIGPWAVVLFGVSGAVTMARWAPLRPYFIGVAAVMLAIVDAHFPLTL